MKDDTTTPIPATAAPFGGKLYVIKRDGTPQRVHFGKVQDRLRILAERKPPLLYVDTDAVSLEVLDGLKPGISTSKLDTLAAQTCASWTTRHYEYAELASRIAISNLHKQTKASFKTTTNTLYKYEDAKSGRTVQLLGDEYFKTVMENMEVLSAALRQDRDYNFDYFGIQTLLRSYLLRVNGHVVERPQHMLMRVAVGIHGKDIKAALESYQLMSQGYFTHATPTLFNAGTPKPQMSSCFLVQMKEDSIEGIYDTLKICAQISKSAGGIGVSVGKIRASGSVIAGTNGTSNGLIPMLRVYNETARYVDQGGGKRKGAFAIYVPPWHADVFDFLDLRKNHGSQHLRARDLFLALWISDLFMERVKADGNWSLFCPHTAPGLDDVYGDKFRNLYQRYEKEGRARRVVKAQLLFKAILTSQIETGVPYMQYKDSVNAKSNQKNLGTIKCSNLCTEIMEYTAPDEVAVCNLASIALPKFIVKETGDEPAHFDFEDLGRKVVVAVRNLNRVIDRNFYPVLEARRSNMRHRPVGLGVQGLADTFMKLGLPFDSPKARKLNKHIFETIYYHACRTSMELAVKEGPYSTFKGSPASKGLLQFDLWAGAKPSVELGLPWEALKADIKAHGMRNSLLVAPMPTASTSQILGNVECFEPIKSNLYTRRTLAGDFICVNKHLVRDLAKLGLWNDSMCSAVIAQRGSVQDIANIPADIKRIYRTVWEIPQLSIIDMAADRGPFIDQSQSLNVYFRKTHNLDKKLASLNMHVWASGLKGTYYLRIEVGTHATAFTVAPKSITASSVLEEKTLKKLMSGEKMRVSAAEFLVHGEEAEEPTPTSDEKDICTSKEECLACGS